MLTAAATFVLVWMGGLVTSHGAGLAVPDWPNSYGYNMFFFPMLQMDRRHFLRAYPPPGRLRRRTADHHSGPVAVRL